MSYYDDQEAYYAKKEAKSSSYFELNPQNIIIYLCYIFICVVTCIATLGLALPWALCSFYRWRASHTIIDGHPLEFTGSGTALFAESNYLLKLLLTIMTAGLFTPYLIAGIQYYVSNNYAHLIDPEQKSAYKLNSFIITKSSCGYYIAFFLSFIISLGAALPWVFYNYYRFLAKNTYYQNNPHYGLAFTAKSGAELFFKGGYGLLWFFGISCTYLASYFPPNMLLSLPLLMFPALAILSVYCWKVKNTHVAKRHS